MDKLPSEIIDLILDQCLIQLTRNNVLEFRLVCRAFDCHLKRWGCYNLTLDYWRMMDRRPQIEALQTIGYHCRSLLLDFVVLRDERELYFNEQLFHHDPAMAEFCETLQHKFAMHEDTFTESDFLDNLGQVLFYCRSTRMLRLALPFQVIPGRTETATRILANTFKALADRPEEGSAPLEVLVMDLVRDISLCQIWTNPSDIANVFTVMAKVKNLVISYRQVETLSEVALVFGASIWSVAGSSSCLETLCLIGNQHTTNSPPNRTWTNGVDTTPDQWSCKTLPRIKFQAGPWTSLRCLELRSMNVSPEVMVQLGDEMGDTLQELYLSDVWLMVDGLRAHGEDDAWLNDLALWVGHPDRRPPEHASWIAMELRSRMTALRICRASSLGYETYVDSDRDRLANFDLRDPCGLGRTLAQRFVEVVTGCEGPPDKETGEPVKYLPPDSWHDHLLHETRPRPSQVVEYDTTAYHLSVANPTSVWLDRGMHEFFPDKTEASAQMVDRFTTTFAKGMQELRMRLLSQASQGLQREVEE
ncbi:uncharacterized protein F5Z01DRAFT_77611 [Emericellopsis atlantica]|uniref:Uncharacterized protein n=1 Tax=Emericellopsis atlantica TaxID=2614577 RepID=A0A9P7ZN29_9HYPO|nr:uncharacterized protein F5Z01DRAFT_77611 [Emericellopsis atlantica]KAG9255159.1 hypothetical protein F5Z01DRAFT_77611 [Emericellopsis atlantica]